jgi:prepilin-type N-terminal cleavage/methylation domain-containing protein
MLRRVARTFGRSCRARLRGFTLPEVLIAVVVLGLLTATIPPLMIMMTRAEFSRNEHRIAESLTRNQIEYIKSVDYKAAANSTAPYGTVPVPNQTYEIDLAVQPIHVDPVTLDHEVLPYGQDEGIQEVTVGVYHADRLVIETRAYKVDR